jgi:hypothetical protein
MYFEHDLPRWSHRGVVGPADWLLACAEMVTGPCTREPSFHHAAHPTRKEGIVGRVRLCITMDCAGTSAASVAQWGRSAGEVGWRSPSHDTP